MFSLYYLFFEGANIQNKNNPAKIIFQPLSTALGQSFPVTLSASPLTILRLFYCCSTVV